MATHDPIPLLIKQLTSSDRKKRVSAVKALGKLRDPRAVEPLIRLARDGRWEVQSAAAKALGLTGDMRVLDTLIQMYNGETYPLISSDGAPHQYDAILGGAAIGLGHLYRLQGDPQIFELLTSRFRREIGRFDNSTTPCTVQGLPYTADRRVTPMLIQAAEADHYWLRYCALEAFGVLGDPEALPILYEAVRGVDQLTYVWASADALALFGNPDADQPLVDGLHRLESGAFPKDDLWYGARAKIVRALGIIGTPLARSVLEQFYSAKDNDQQILGAIGLAHMYDKRVFQSLMNGVSLDNLWLGEACAIALGALGDPAAIPTLEEFLRARRASDMIEDAIHELRLQMRH